GVVSIRVAAGVNGPYVASAWVEADEMDAVEGNNAAQVTTMVDVSADIGVALAAAVNPMVQTGSGNTLTLTVTNGGPTAAAGVNWSLGLPAAFTFVSTTAGAHDGSTVGGWISGTIPSLAAGADQAITVDVVANALSEAAIASAFAF